MPMAVLTAEDTHSRSLLRCTVADAVAGMGRQLLDHSARLAARGEDEEEDLYYDKVIF